MEQEKNMRQVVEACQKSGLTRKEFATTQGLKLSKLKYWIEKIRKEKASSPNFIQLRPMAARSADLIVEIGYPNGASIKVATTDFPFLSRLIRLY